MELFLNLCWLSLLAPSYFFVAAAQFFARAQSPRKKFIRFSAGVSVRSWLRARSVVSGDLGQRRSARYAGRDGRIVSR